jgi:hypothetical protein
MLLGACLPHFLRGALGTSPDAARARITPGKKRTHPRIHGMGASATNNIML